MHKLFPLLLSLLLFNCKESKKTKYEEFKFTTNPPSDTLFTPSDDSPPSWATQLIERYIRQTDNEIIRAARQDRIPMTWISSKENSDTAIYFIIQIGHSFENKRVPDGWLYIDSLTRNLYELDIATEKRTLWKK